MPASDAPILVTGAAGHVGANLVHRLVADGERVRVLLRPGDNNEAIEGLEVEQAMGDLRRPESLAPAVKDCRQIFHVASLVSTIDGSAAHKRAIYETNVLGARHLLSAAKAANVQRVVVTGSFSAVGYDLDQPSRPADESWAFYPYHRAMPYERSKVLQEHEVLKACVDGMDALIVTSCAVIGGHDYLPSRMGRTICRFANNDLNMYVPGGFEFVAARDIVEGHVLAMKRGRTGQKYVIATQFLTLDDIWDMLQDITGQLRPGSKIPTGLLLPVAEAVSWTMSRLRPRATQLLTPGAIRRLSLKRHANTTKARTELGFSPSDIADAFAEAYAFHYERGAITNPKARPPRKSGHSGKHDASTRHDAPMHA